MNENVVELAKNHFLEAMAKGDPKFAVLLRHIPEVEKWALKLLAKKPEAKKDVVLLGVWMHDIGNVVGDSEADHAINSEAEVKRFLAQLGVQEETILAVAHCVRAHRCKDVQPESLEAKILAVADSASHMTDVVYADLARGGQIDMAVSKLGRDYRDVGVFPELKEMLTPLYESWTKLLEAWSKI